MDRMISRGMRLAFCAALLATMGFGARTAVAAPGADTAAPPRCDPPKQWCICDGFITCHLGDCPVCP